MKIRNHTVDYSFLDKCINKIRHSKIYNNSFTCAIRRKKINNTDFTIISNNCWGGICYEYFGLQKTSPTVGCYFFSDDYIKFISNLRHYLSLSLNIIPAESSRHYQLLKKKNETSVPVGQLGDIEIIFLHYKNPQDVLDKWHRRCLRVNWNNLIIKYSNMNGATEKDIKDFLCAKIEKSKKLLFLNKHYSFEANAFIFPEFSEESFLLDDTLHWKKHFDLYQFINNSLDS